MSVLIKPVMRTADLPRIPILASLAVLDVMDGLPLPVRVKWPNDILFGGKKLAGILVKSRTEGDVIPWVVAGFGVNLVRSGETEPEEIRGKIAFLEDISQDMTRDGLGERIVEGVKGFVNCLEDDNAWEQAVRRWTRFAAWDTPYLHRDGTRETPGMPVRLAGDGGLVLRTDRGEVTVHSGEIMESIQDSKFKIEK